MTWFFFSRLASSAIAFIVLLLLARLLDPADFGRYATLQLGATVVFSVLLAWAGMATVRFYHDPMLKGQGLPMAYGTSLGAVLLGLPIVLVAGYAIAPEHLFSIFAASLFCVGHAVHEIGLAGLRVLKNGPRFGLSMLIRPLIGVVLAIALILRGGGAEEALLAMATGAILSALLSWTYVVRREGIAAPDSRILWPMLRFGVPLGIVSSGTMVLTLISQALLGWQINAVEVGYFAAAQVLALRVITMPMITLAQAADASIFRAAEVGRNDEAQQAIQRYASFLLLCSAPLAAVIISANDTVASLAFGPQKGAEIAGHLPFLGLGAFLIGLQGAFFGFAFTISKASTSQLLILAGLIMLHFALTLSAIRMFGSIGASYGALATSTVAIGIYIFVGSRLHPVRIPTSEIKQIGAAVLVAIPFGIAADLLSSPVSSILVILAGGVAFSSLLLVTRHTGFTIIVNKARSVSKRRRQV